MNTRWYALYVRRQRDRPENLSAQEHRELTENINLAMTLGATIVYRESEDVAGAILDFVRSEKVGVLVMGRPSRTGLTGSAASPPASSSGCWREAGGSTSSSSTSTRKRRPEAVEPREINAGASVPGRMKLHGDKRALQREAHKRFLCPGVTRFSRFLKAD